MNSENVSNPNKRIINQNLKYDDTNSNKNDTLCFKYFHR